MALSVFSLVEELLVADIVAVEIEGIVFTLSDRPGGGESTDMTLCCSFGVVLTVKVHSTDGIALAGVGLGVLVT